MSITVINLVAGRRTRRINQDGVADYENIAASDIFQSGLRACWTERGRIASH